LQQKTLKLLSWVLILSLLVAALPGVALATERPVVAQAAPSDALSADALANATYESMVANGPVQLVDGKYEDTANKIVVVLVDQPRAYGTLDGQEVAAVLIGENGGGSGIFTSLAIVLDQDGAPVNVASSLLGDRVEVTSLVITNDQIVVEIVRQGPDDPMCCPTELVRISYALDGNLLVSVDDVVLGSAPQVIVNQAPEGGVQTTVVAPTPYDASASAMPTGAPIHTMVSFVTGDPANPQSDGGPLLVVYPVDDYVQLWQDAGDATIADLVAALQRTLTDQPDALEVSLPIVPPATDVETAAQVSYLTGDGYSGVRFVARATLGGEPTADEQLAYYFSGLTDDGRYLIGAQWPVATTAAGDALNATTDADWTPALSEIDAIVAFHVANRRAQRLCHRPVDGVERRRPVQCQDRDAILALSQ